jgi:hypothetical protein
MMSATLDDLVDTVTCPRDVADRGAAFDLGPAPAQGWLA